MHQITAPRTIPVVLDRAVERFGEAEALVDGDLRLSFRELADRADEVARALVASGVEAGDRVALWAPNTAEWVLAALGAYRAGAVVVTVNTRFKGAEAAHVLAPPRCGCSSPSTASSTPTTSPCSTRRAARVASRRSWCSTASRPAARRVGGLPRPGRGAVDAATAARCRRRRARRP